jgi:hypothetical protein
MKTILKDLNLEEKYDRNFSEGRVKNVKDFLSLDVPALEKLNVDHDDLDIILTHI